MRDVYVMGNILRDEFVMNHHEFVTRPSLVEVNDEDQEEGGT
jgi:hypothetical protein